jgi:decaprenylphospho-beta-D-ribofuranose 2-oxidase
MASRPWRAPKDRSLPVGLGGLALNSWSVAAFNALYWRRVPAAGRERPVGAARFFHPLDAVRDWNRLYGRHGLRQFQCVLPDSSAADGLVRLLTQTAKVRATSFLAVLKTLGPTSRGMLSFPQPGFTLALDFPGRRGIDDVLLRLETITRDYGGRVYLAKDSALTVSGFVGMYPRLDQFRQVLAQIDPRRRFSSQLSRRLNIREERP